MTANQTKALFYSAALFNWGAVLILSLLAPWLGLVPAPQHSMFGQIALAAIFVFGCGYWMVGRAPRAHRGIAVIGVWGKVLVVAVVLANWWAGSATPQMAALVGGDVIYTALFLLFLKRNPA